ncbi:MAG: DUF359 domain-containing protein [Promethearchaeota archaeon]
MDSHAGSYLVADAGVRKRLAAAGSEWGTIIPAEGGDKEKTAVKFKQVVDGFNPKKVVLVGDVVTDSCFRVGLHPDLAIVDGKTHRGYYQGKQGAFDDFKSVDNPAGEIRAEAWELVAALLEGERSCLLSVNGEEDLLAIPAIMEAPVPSIVAFGQPPVTDAEPPLPEGVAYILVDERVKGLCAGVLDGLKKL